MLHVYMFFSPSFFLFCTHYRKLCFVLSISQIFAQTLLSHIAFLVIWQISYFTRESCGTGLCWERHTPRGAPRLTWWMTAPPPIWSRAMWHVLISRCCTSTASKCLFFSFSRQQCFCVKWVVFCECPHVVVFPRLLYVIRFFPKKWMAYLLLYQRAILVFPFTSELFSENYLDWLIGLFSSRTGILDVALAKRFPNSTIISIEENSNDVSKEKQQNNNI